jgi:hypothetical protein
MSYPRHDTRISVFGLRPSFGFRVSGFGFRPLLYGLVVALALNPGRLWACAACTGQSDSPMAKGMNWGIMSLLVVIAMVLGGVASFFVFLAKKSAAVSAAAAQLNPGRASVPASPSFSGNHRQTGLAGTLALPDRANPLFGSTNTV